MCGRAGGKGIQAESGFETMTELTPIEVFCQATQRGLQLSFEPPDTLIVNPASGCSKDFADTLTQHKWRLFTLLQLPFVTVYSKALEETVFFAQDEDTKAALVEVGAQESSIYTRAELTRRSEIECYCPPFLNTKVDAGCGLKVSG